MKRNNKRIIVIITLVAIIASVMTVSVLAEETNEGFICKKPTMINVTHFELQTEINIATHCYYVHLYRKNINGTNLNFRFCKDYLARYENGDDFKVVTSFGNDYSTNIPNEGKQTDFLYTNVLIGACGYVMADVYLNQYDLNGRLYVDNTNLTSMDITTYSAFGRYAQ